MKSTPSPHAPADSQLHSPTELVFTEGKSSEDAPLVGYASLFWEPTPTFPAYLRKCRENAGLKLRDASNNVGISIANLGRLENGELPKKPNIDLLNKLADLYGVDTREMLHHAGVRVQMPESVDLRAIADKHFDTIFLNEKLRPTLIDETALQFFSYRMKRAVLDLIDKLVEQPEPQKLILELKKQSDQRSQ